MARDEIESGEVGQGIRWYVTYDPEPPDPREWDEAGHKLFWHRQYDLGDKGAADLLARSFPDDYGSWDEIATELREAHGAEVLAVYLYDHSGLSLSTSDATFRAFDSAGWDWGTLGLVYMTAAEVTHEFGADDEEAREKARRLMKAEINTFNDYLSGAVYGYVVERIEPLFTASGKQVSTRAVHLDSCWGFYGLEDAIAEAKASAESFLKDAKEAS